jgi:hypothetical protein
MAKVGRPSKLTPEVIERICEALRAGNFIEPSCEYAGVSHESYFKWMRRANDDDASPLHLQFKESVTRARSTAEIRNVAMIQRAAQQPNHWTAAAWWLERVAPARWGKQQKITAEITGANGGPIRVEDPRALLLQVLGVANNGTEPARIVEDED